MLAVEIHHITDLHIPEEHQLGDFPHVQENVLRQFAWIEQNAPDLLVISGDLSMADRSEFACGWLQAHLPDVPVIVIPGNHDDPEMVKRLFGEWPFQQEYADCSVLFLDTSSCTLPQAQMDALRQASSEQTCLLFMHHPPYPIGGGFMAQNHPLQNHQEAAAALAASPAQAVFCGHFHNEANLTCDGFDLFLTPSPAYQVSLQADTFTQEDYQPSVRVIQAGSRGIETHLIRV
jgi:Icc protein